MIMYKVSYVNDWQNSFLLLDDRTFIFRLDSRRWTSFPRRMMTTASGSCFWRGVCGIPSWWWPESPADSTSRTVLTEQSAASSPVPPPFTRGLTEVHKYFTMGPVLESRFPLNHLSPGQGSLRYALFHFSVECISWSINPIDHLFCAKPCDRSWKYRGQHRAYSLAGNVDVT